MPWVASETDVLLKLIYILRFELSILFQLGDEVLLSFPTLVTGKYLS